MIRRNFTMLTGRATKDVELKDAKNSKVATIRLAVNERIKKRDDTYEEKTMYIDAECWGQRAEYAANNIRRGDIVSVVGKLEQDEWTGKDGVSRQKHKVYVNWDLQVDKYDSQKRASGDGQTQSQSQPVAAASSASDGDLPF